MADLKTKYMGLELGNPIIAGSSGLTGSVEGVKRCADAGAGAVVLKSMFEELVIVESEELQEELIQTEHPEAYEYLRAELGMRLGPRPYLKFIEDVKNNVSVPVIASVNCISSKWWAPYAGDIESAGADGIELNISHFPGGGGESSAELEKRYVDIVGEVVGHVSIPVAVKLGFYFTSLGNVLKEIVASGAGALVLFNRLYSVDVDVEKGALIPGMTFSSPEEAAVPLRWIGLLSGTLDCDIASSTGVHDVEGVLKMLMVGATAVQVCSPLYRNGPEHIAVLRDGLKKWLDGHGHSSVDDIRGIAVRDAGKRDILLKRLQYVKALEEAAKYGY